jgi:hypothetical protein
MVLSHFHAISSYMLQLYERFYENKITTYARYGIESGQL